MNQPDRLTIAMQDEAIQIAELRLHRPLTDRLKEKIRLRRWGFMGLEAIIDNVSSLEVNDLEQYLENLDK